MYMYNCLYQHFYYKIKNWLFYKKNQFTSVLLYLVRHKDHLNWLLTVNMLNTMPVDKVKALPYKQRVSKIWDSNKFMKYRLINDESICTLNLSSIVILVLYRRMPCFLTNGFKNSSTYSYVLGHYVCTSENVYSQQ